MAFSASIRRTVKAVFLRIIFTRGSLLFFFISTIACVVQGLLQGLLFNADLNQYDLVQDILAAGEVCEDVPFNSINGTSPCHTIFETGNPQYTNATIPVGFRRSEQQDLSSAPKILGLTFSPIANETGDVVGVDLTYANGTERVLLNNQCTRVLLYPAQVLRNSKNEAFALAAIQLWLLGISIYALAAQSIPHVLTAMSMRTLSVGWSAYVIWRTMDVNQRFVHLVSGNDSACRFDLFPDYVWDRLILQVPDLIVGSFALLVLILISRKIVRTFSEHTFTCVGPPAHIVRLYSYLLAVTLSLHLGFLLALTSIGLWIESLLHSAIKEISQHTPIFLASFIFIIVTIIPWVASGYYGILRESRALMIFHLLLTTTYTCGWSWLFYSQVYRWIFLLWPFFATCTISAFIAFILSATFGVVCWMKFGSGLAHYLHVEKALADSDFEPAAFATDAGASSDVKTRRTSLSIVKKDTNWDFKDAENPRPPIYIVDLQESSRGL